MHVTCTIPETKSVLSSKITYSVGSTSTILAKSVTYRSFCPDNYSKCYYHHYMEQLANIQAFQRWCKKSVRSITSLATYVRNWVRDCEICIQDKCINNTRTTPELFHIPEWDLGPEDLKQIDLLPELPPSGGYENIHTAIDVFSRYAFAYPVSNPTAVNTAKVILDSLTRHAYLATLIITDKGSVFVSQVIHQMNTGNKGTNIYPLQSWIITGHTISVLIVNQAECSMAESYTWF